jgi:outer membrane protein TolC
MDSGGDGTMDGGGFDLADGLSRREGEAVALVFNPDLREARLRAGVTLARAEYAGLWEDPVFGLDVERILESVDDPWVVGASIGFTLPLSGRLAVEEARAEAEHRAELRRVAAAEWVTRMEVRRAWMEWSAQRHRAALAAETDERLGGVVGIVEASHRAGVLSRGEARLFAIERATREIEWRAAEAAVREAEARLRGLMGLSPGAPVTLVDAALAVDLDAALAGAVGSGPGGADGAPRAAMVDDGLLDMLAERNPAMSVRRDEYEVAEQSLRLAIRGQYPDLEIGPGLGSEEGQGRVLLGVSVPLAVWNGGRGEIAAARAEREVARGAFEAEFERQAGRLAEGLARLEAARARREAHERIVVPQDEEQDAEARRLAELAQVDALLLL